MGTEEKGPDSNGARPRMPIRSDGTETVQAATVLPDLFEDYLYFKTEAEAIGFGENPLLYQRMVRASILAFLGYFDGVLNRWIGKFDPGFDLKRSTGSKLGRIRAEIRRKAGPDRHLNLGKFKTIRNKMAHLSPIGNNLAIVDHLSSDRFSQEAELLLKWLKTVGYWVDLTLHDLPGEMIQPYFDTLGGVEARPSSDLSGEDEELVRLAEMTFLELDFREAVDGRR